MASVIESVEAAVESGAGLVGEFCNSPHEWHALWFGVCSGWSSVDPSERFDLNQIPDHYPQDVKSVILEEYHYYTFGYTVGRTLANRWVQAGTGVVAIVAAAKSAGVI